MFLMPLSQLQESRLHHLYTKCLDVLTFAHVFLPCLYICIPGAYWEMLDVSKAINKKGKMHRVRGGSDGLD